LSTSDSEELNAWYQHYGLETPSAEWEDLYKSLASPNSEYRLIERFLPRVCHSNSRVTARNLRTNNPLNQAALQLTPNLRLIPLQ